MGSPQRPSRLFGGIVLIGLASFAACGADARPGRSINPATVAQTAPMTARERTNLQKVLAFRREVTAARHAASAERYLAEDYIEHDPNTGAGRADFLKTPGTTSPAPFILHPASSPVVRGARGDFVWLVFEDEATDPRDPARSYHYDSFDLFRMRDGRIAEHWDSSRRATGSPAVVAAPAAGSSASHGGDPSDEERRNVATAAVELKDMLEYGHLELADTVIAAGYIQHNPYVSQGRQAFKTFMARPANTPVEAIGPAWKSPPLLTIANGPYVLMMWNRTDKEPADPARTYVRNHFDLLRIAHGEVQEHWDEATIRPPSPR